ncbi:MAG: hypothetical protein AB7G93_22985 [Bdellovibrionales bacterium]
MPKKTIRKTAAAKSRTSKPKMRAKTAKPVNSHVNRQKPERASKKAEARPVGKTATSTKAKPKVNLLKLALEMKEAQRKEAEKNHRNVKSLRDWDKGPSFERDPKFAKFAGPRRRVG